MAIHPEDNAQPMSHKSRSGIWQADMSYLAPHEHQRHQDSSDYLPHGNDGQFLGYAARAPRHLQVGFPS
jgi:hypothetical protein